VNLAALLAEAAGMAVEREVERLVVLLAKAALGVVRLDAREVVAAPIDLRAV
jgi:hypothetical protein